MSADTVAGRCRYGAIAFRYQSKPNLDALVPLRELSTRNLFVNHSLNCTAARQVRS